MGGRRRTILGFDDIINRSDEGQGINRLLDSLDWQYNQETQQRMINVALKRLSRSDRTFVKQVLSGKSWREMKMSKQLFSYKMKKVENALSPR